jgi:hypothetical protein
MSKEILPGQVYKHYKGNFYLIKGIGVCSTDLREGEVSVIYQRLDEKCSNHFWYREMQEFMEEIVNPAYPFEKQYKIKRFSLVKTSDLPSKDKSGQ